MRDSLLLFRHHVFFVFWRVPFHLICFFLSCLFTTFLNVFFSTGSPLQGFTNSSDRLISESQERSTTSSLTCMFPTVRNWVNAIDPVTFSLCAWNEPPYGNIKPWWPSFLAYPKSSWIRYSLETTFIKKKSTWIVRQVYYMLFVAGSQFMTAGPGISLALCSWTIPDPLQSETQVVFFTLT